MPSGRSSIRRRPTGDDDHFPFHPPGGLLSMTRRSRGSYGYVAYCPTESGAMLRIFGGFSEPSASLTRAGSC